MHDGQMSWNGKCLTPVHDRIYGRPSACYRAPDTAPEGTPSPPSPSVREGVRQEPRRSSEVDINDNNSVAHFWDNQRSVIERLASVEHQLAEWAYVASAIGLSVFYSALLVIFLNLATVLLHAV